MTNSKEGSSPQTEAEQTRNNLALILGEAGKEVDDELLDLFVNAGIRSKTAVGRISGDSYKRGQEAAATVANETATELSGKIKELQDQLAANEAKGVAKKPKTTANDPALSLLAEQMAGLTNKMDEMGRENDALRVEAQTRERTQIVLDEMAKQGISEPSAALLLIRGQDGVDFIPDPALPGEMIAVRADDASMPVGGPGSRDTVKDWLTSWKQTTMGKRFQSAPTQSTGGAGVQGGTAGHAGINLLSDAAMASGLEDLGIAL